MLSTVLVHLCKGLECFLKFWNAFDSVDIHLYRVRMPSTGWKCFLQGWNTFVQGWNAFYRVGMLSTVLVYLCTELECFQEGWNAFDSVGIPLYRVGMLSTGWECFLQGWNTFVQGWNAF
jgi:hypothetical protein